MADRDDLRDWLRRHVKLHEKALDKVVQTLEDEVWVFCPLDLARLRAKQGLQSLFPALIADDITAAIDAVAWEGMAPPDLPSKEAAPGSVTSKDAPVCAMGAARSLAQAPTVQPHAPPTPPPPTPPPLVRDIPPALKSSPNDDAYDANDASDALTVRLDALPPRQLQLASRGEPEDDTPLWLQSAAAILASSPSPTEEAGTAECLGQAASMDLSPPVKPSAWAEPTKGAAPPRVARAFFADGRPQPAPVELDLNFDLFFCLGFNAVVVVAAAAAIATMYAYYSPEDLGLGRVLAADGSIARV